MHHYPFHVGDYIRATAHLDIVEDCIYRRLIDLYMETELPIPNETQQVIRRLRLGSSGLILETILKEFFTLEADNCWHNSRCDREILEYKRLADVSRINGKLGGRPKKTQRVILDNPAITQQEPVGLQPITNNQEPITKNQEPITKTTNQEDSKTKKPKVKNITPAALLQARGVDSKIAEDWIILRKQKKAAITETALNGIEREAAKAGLPLQDALKICCERGWAGFKSDWLIESGRNSRGRGGEINDPRAVEASLRAFLGEDNLTIEGESKHV